MRRLKARGLDFTHAAWVQVSSDEEQECQLNAAHAEPRAAGTIPDDSTIAFPLSC